MTAGSTVIVGGGMAGGLLACLLAQGGMAVTVVDAAPAPLAPEGEPGLRVSALTLASQRMLAHVGAWQRMDAGRLGPYTHMSVRDGDGTGCVQFDAGQARCEQLGWMVENQAVVAALYQSALALGVDWRCQSPVAGLKQQSSGWQVTLEGGDCLSAALLVGADGARSRVRAAAGIPSSPRDTGHVALVANLRTTLPHGGCARQWFLDSGPLAVLPMFGDGHVCSLVWSAWPAEAERLRQMPDEVFAEALTQASGNELGLINATSERQAFPIHNLHASDYVRDRLALVGDAAHVVHPLAGQGINLGLLDAGVLAEEVLANLARGVDPTSSRVLQRYQRRRRGHNLVMQKSFIGFKRLFEQTALPVRLLRNAGMNLVNQAGPLKAEMSRAALGLHGDVPLIARG